MHNFACTLSLALLLGIVQCQYEKLFTDKAAFVDHPYPTIPIQCTELGPSGSYLDSDHTQEGAGYFPALSWPSPTEDTKEYVLISEDPDAPFNVSVIHGLYYGIPRVFTGLQYPDFEIDNTRGQPFMLRGGFKYGQNRRGSVYLAPRAPHGQGPHRYFFELVALNETIDQNTLSSPATVDDIARAVEGKVAGWGAWMGLWEK
ncbi:PEBP-like protein [Aspergillus sclerotioniger CBS 115572]|uniref:PEBP-like protein n=1 Tax=Aspergillus sclerotioniger CBS 115572 TaxID=1450535 RepID=A0A317WY95_9EURO|nr:PEBP-like protein [Aspergillus sclerotioniger CBS 115572]PWY91329.1 PEBP-like protein [Aspergillus sclerotioniger CBS 115572]